MDESQNQPQLRLCEVYGSGSTHAVIDQLAREFHCPAKAMPTPGDAYLVAADPDVLEDAFCALSDRLTDGWPDLPIIWHEAAGRLSVYASAADFIENVRRSFAEIFGRFIRPFSIEEASGMLQRGQLEYLLALLSNGVPLDLTVWPGFGADKLTPEYLDGLARHWLQQRSELANEAPAQAGRNAVTPDLQLFDDGDGYICFKQRADLPKPGICWVLHAFGGWQAFVDRPEENEPIYQSGAITFPTDGDLAEAASALRKLDAEGCNMIGEGTIQPAAGCQRAEQRDPWEGETPFGILLDGGSEADL